MATLEDIRLLRLRRLNSKFNDAVERHKAATKAAMFHVDAINAAEREMATLESEIKRIESEMFDVSKEVD